MRDIHDVFHVSQLRKCPKVPDQQINPTVEELQPDLVYQERPIKILDTLCEFFGAVTAKRRQPGKEKMLSGKNTPILTGKIVMEEAHNSAYSIHPGSTKMYLDLKTDYLVEGHEGGYRKICGTM
ncbi:hypothetical protein U9M48_022511 [Paspalum notatum var. saurae]|uniref:Retrotransposon protein, putative, Ty3-gypsy subclass n=1 Tax=Paspalum notatum var. saurae TaxID=547442 RepID=A0AAQ3TN79_PASNO